MVRKTRGLTAAVFRFLSMLFLGVLLIFGGVAFPATDKSKATATEPTVKRAEKLLNTLAGTPQDAIPDAVLNHTQCVLVFPSGADLEGVFSCRRTDQNWNRPGAVVLTGMKRAKGTDYLIFLLSNSASRALQTGRLDLSSTVPGPLVRINALVAPVELRSDALSYSRAGAHLKGVALRGSVRPEKGRYWAEPQVRQYSAALVSFFNLIVPTGIIIHHTATIPTNGKVPTSEREVDQYHKARGFDVLCFGKEYHVAYHYLVLPDGKVQQGRPERCEGAHAPGYNSYLGISVAGDFSSEDNPRGANGPAKPTSRQMRSLVELCRKLRKQYNIPLQHVLRHSDVAPTQCPGDNFPFRYLVSQLAAAG